MTEHGYEFQPGDLALVTKGAAFVDPRARGQVGTVQGVLGDAGLVIVADLEDVANGAFGEGVQVVDPSGLEYVTPEDLPADEAPADDEEGDEKPAKK